ncbi:hypothetical protein BJ742DRAFT_738204 [Cladochytrium replicatum]|nr:hypothetical protein BJ742DRAFT_738204 [Cladochytrium replicatum]
MWRVFIGLLQIAALALVLLAWSLFDRVLDAVQTKSDALHIWFGAPSTAKAIYVGEIVNMTLEYKGGGIQKRRNFYRVQMTIGLRCAGGKDGGLSVNAEETIVYNPKDEFFWDYNVTDADLAPEFNEALCSFNLLYTYSSNVSPAPRTDKSMSSVFRLSRSARPEPLPRQNDLLVPLADRFLALQIRKAPMVPESQQIQKQVYKPQPPLQYVILPTDFSISPEDGDDPLWVRADDAPMEYTSLWIGIGCLLLVRVILVSVPVRSVMGNIGAAFAKFWVRDIELAISAPADFRRRRGSHHPNLSYQQYQQRQRHVLPQ